MMTKSLLLPALIFLFPTAVTADVPLVPKPNIETVVFGLQAVRMQANQEVPITALDVVAGQKQLSEFSSMDQSYVRDQVQKYEASPPRFTGDIVLHSAAKSAVLPHAPYALKLQNPTVSFVLHPYLELALDTLAIKIAKNDITAYGQPVDVNSLRFAEFLRSLSPLQKARLLHSAPLTIGDLSLKQRLFVSDLWQASSRPECAKLCSIPNTQVTVGFCLEAVVEQASQSGSATYHLQLPQPVAGQDFFRFNAAEGQPGQVWMRF